MGQLLFIDDDSDALEMYTKAVSLADHQAYVAVDAKQAWKVIENYPLDLIFVDINLPGVSGLQLLREFSQNEKTRSIPVIILSAVPEGEVDRELLNDSELFLSKPVSLHRLLTVIKKYETS